VSGTNYRTPPTDAFVEWHPVLRQMRIVVERWIDAGEQRGWDILKALAICAGHAAFADEPRKTDERGA
jgi:hypothetical protein